MDSKLKLPLLINLIKMPLRLKMKNLSRMKANHPKMRLKPLKNKIPSCKKRGIS